MKNNQKKTVFAIIFGLTVTLCLQSCQFVDAETGEPIDSFGGGGYAPQPSYGNQGGQMGPGGRRLDSLTVRRVHFQANVDAQYTTRRQEVSNYASAYFEQTGKIMTDEQATRHFGFECHLRQVGQIQNRKIRPDEAPANIRSKFSN